ncbi:MAG: HupE/UreJ family protein [Pyrinomonadaceae bacterium]|nr:HupE/UreJ family protein [Pyrinomonadaceae bacterium]
MKSFGMWNKTKGLIGILAVAFGFIAVMLPSKASAHNPEQSYIYLRVYENSIKGRFEITSDDLNRALDVGLERGFELPDAEPHLEKIRSHMLENAAFSSSQGPYKIKFTEASILRGGELGDYLQLHFDLEELDEIPEPLVIDYRFLFDKYRSHRAMLVIEYNWKAGIHENESIPSLLFGPGDTKQELSLTKGASIWLGFYAMVKLGVWHIWIGIDHILFLLALLLPSVLMFGKNEELDDIAMVREPADRFRPALMNVVKIVTFFTIAHSITLSLASLEIINLPSRLVESIIAISIALAALHNIKPIFLRTEWLIAFGFGLFHGFGFASVLADKGFGGDYLIYSLLGFNVGVELGQLAIICLVFPVLYLLRKTVVYPKLLLFGSIFLILVSIYWFVERAFEIDLPIGGMILRTLGLL